MANAYLVARVTEVTYPFVAGMGGRVTKDMIWRVPVFNKDTRIFTNKTSADAYAKKKNHELHNPKVNADGSFNMDVSGWSDFKVISVTKG